MTTLTLNNFNFNIFSGTARGLLTKYNIPLCNYLIRVSMTSLELQLHTVSDQYKQQFKPAMRMLYKESEKARESDSSSDPFRLIHKGILGNFQ